MEDVWVWGEGGGIGNRKCVFLRLFLTRINSQSIWRKSCFMMKASIHAIHNSVWYPSQKGRWDAVQHLHDDHANCRVDFWYYSNLKTERWICINYAWFFDWFGCWCWCWIHAKLYSKMCLCVVQQLEWVSCFFLDVVRFVRGVFVWVVLWYVLAISICLCLMCLLVVSLITFTLPTWKSDNLLKRPN